MLVRWGMAALALISFPNLAHADYKVGDWLFSKSGNHCLAQYENGAGQNETSLYLQADVGNADAFALVVNKFYGANAVNHQPPSNFELLNAETVIFESSNLQDSYHPDLKLLTGIRGGPIWKWLQGAQPTVKLIWASGKTASVAVEGARETYSWMQRCI